MKGFASIRHEGDPASCHDRRRDFVEQHRSRARFADSQAQQFNSFGDRLQEFGIDRLAGIATPTEEFRKIGLGTATGFLRRTDV